jgi:hypothetical protein
MKAGVRRVFLWSWVVTLPITLLGGYWLYSAADRFAAFGVRFDPEHPSFTLSSVGRNEAKTIIQRLTASGVSTTTGGSTLRAIHLFVPKPELAKLNSHLPQSGFKYVRGRMLIDGKLEKIKYRYRGDTFYRWAWAKKSMRVKTSKKKLFDGVRTFNLLAPRSDEQLNNYLSYQLAKQMGLMVPNTELVRVYLNGEDQGILVFVEQIKEIMLRRYGRMPGDIYRGELVADDFFTDSGIRRLFSSAAVWDKVASNNHYPEESVLPLQRLLELVAEPESPALYPQLSGLLDIEAWARYSVYETLTQSRHGDDFHNWRIYYDPWRGKMVPIVWDSMGWFDTLRGEKMQFEIHASRLMKKLLLNADFRRTRQRLLTAFFQSGKDNEFLELVYRTTDVMKQEVITDPLVKPADPDEVGRAMQRLEDHIRSVFAYLKEEVLSGKHSIELAASERIVKSESAIRSGTEKHSTTWSGVVTINGMQIINDLIIEPGTDIRMAAGASIIIRGRLQANGTELKPIRFLPVASNSKPWGTIALVGPGARDSSLRHCEMSGGSGHKEALAEYSAMLSVHDVQRVTIADCLFRDNHLFDDMVHAVYSDIRFERVTFNNALSDALDLDLSKVVITDSQFADSGNDALDLMTTEAFVSRSVFERSGDKGISVGESSDLFGVNNSLIDNQIGVQSKDGSTAVLFNQSLKNNGIALHAYKKNWQYGTGGTIFLAKSIVSGGEIAARAQKQSQIHLFDSFVGSPLGGKRVTFIDTDGEAMRDASSDQYLPDKGSVLAIIEERVERLAKEQPAIWQLVNPNLRGARQFE